MLFIHFNTIKHEGGIFVKKVGLWVLSLVVLAMISACSDSSNETSASDSKQEKKLSGEYAEADEATKAIKQLYTAIDEEDVKGVQEALWHSGYDPTKKSEVSKSESEARDFIAYWKSRNVKSNTYLIPFVSKDLTKDAQEELKAGQKEEERDFFMVLSKYTGDSDENLTTLYRLDKFKGTYYVTQMTRNDDMSEIYDLFNEKAKEKYNLQ